LKWYYPTERFHAYISFPAIIIYLVCTNAINDMVFLIYGLLVCIVILYQGQLYWKLKLQVLEAKKIDQGKQIKFFRNSKKINVFLFILMPLILYLQLVLQDWDIGNNPMLFWGILANMFAILEHINYYHTQLMIDNKYDFQYVLRNKKLKKSSLAKDLREKKI